MKGVTFNSLASGELSDAIEYYDGEQRGLGGEFRDEVERAIGLLSHYPFLGREVASHIRRLNLLRFPYYLLYRPLEDGRLRILAVADQRRRPGHGAART